MEEFARNLAKLIRESRLSFHMTQEELARKAGVSRSTIGRLEDPLRSASVRYNSVYPVVRALKINPNRIFYFETYEDYSNKELLLDRLLACSKEEQDLLIPILQAVLEGLNSSDETASCS